MMDFFEQHPNGDPVDDDHVDADSASTTQHSASSAGLIPVATDTRGIPSSADKAASQQRLRFSISTIAFIYALWQDWNLM